MTDTLNIPSLLRLFWRRRIRFLAVAALPPLALLAWLPFAEPIYESKVVLQIGQLTPSERIEAPPDLVSRIRSEHAIWRDNRPLPRVAAVDFLDRRTTLNVIEILVEGVDAAEARALSAQVAGDLVAGHLERQGARRTQLDATARQVQGALDRAQQRQYELQEQAEMLGPRDAARLALIAEMGQLDQSLPALSVRATAITAELAILEDNPTRIVFGPSEPLQPSSPRKLLLLAAALLAGATFGLIVVLVPEWMREEPVG